MFGYDYVNNFLFCVQTQFVNFQYKFDQFIYCINYIVYAEKFIAKLRIASIKLYKQ